MKSRIFATLLMLLVFVVAVNAQNNNESKKRSKKKSHLPVMTFKATTFDYGTIEQGGDGTHEFVFKNTGKSPLIISNVRSSCGCTIPKWSKAPVPRRKEGKITVKYDTNRLGKFTKIITVYSNSDNAKITLTIRGTVVRKTS